MTEDKKTGYGVAIIGCGDMGKIHAEAWNKREDSRILAVFDIDRSRSEEMAKETGARVCNSWQEAIELHGVSMVSICTPICFHAEMVIHAASCGRHILSEKSIALTLEDANRMIDSAKKADVKLVISYQYRTLPEHYTWHSLIQQKVLKGPMFVRFEDVRGIRPKTAMHRRSMNGGPIIDMGGHFFDLMRYYTGEEPVSVFAQGHCYGACREELQMFDDLAEDVAEIIVRFTGGHILSAYINWGMPANFPESLNMSIRTPEVVSTPVDEKIMIRQTDKEEFYDFVSDIAGTEGRVEDLVNAVQHNKRPEVAGEDGRVALAVSLAAVESIRTGKTITL